MPPCLVCGRPTTAIRMGMDACRACIVFYRRNKENRDKLHCFRGTHNCNDYLQGLFSCRKCRLDRLVEIMAAGRTEDDVAINTLTPSPTSSSTQSGSPFERPGQFHIDTNTKTLERPTEIITPPHRPTLSIIEKIRANYRTLSVMRRTSELQLRGIFLNPFEADREEYDIVPCTYQIMNEATRILINCLFDFIPAVFPEFNDLSISDKWLLIRNYQKIFHCIDSSMRLQRQPGNDNGRSYTTYLSEDTVDIYFSDCSDQQNVLEAARTFRDRMHEDCVNLKTQITRVQPTEDEYLAILGIAFWTVENTELNENLMNLADRYRKEILSELTARYKESIGEEEGTIRIGLSYCLMMAVQKAEMNMKWEYEVYRMLNVFDENTFMYKLQMHRPDSVC